MPSKPPISKAKKAQNRAAKKLPGHIAKRFKNKAMKDKEEDEMWAAIAQKKEGTRNNSNIINNSNIHSSSSGEKDKDGDASEPTETVVSPTALCAPSAVVMNNTSIKGRKKGMTNRLLKLAMREKIII
jgi:hypothetical protein